MKPRGDLKRHELIGLKVEILSSTDPNHAGLAGRVVDETKRMLIIEVDGIEKKVAKKNCIFEFENGATKQRVKGSEIEFRPEDRVKRVK
ncbi:MAG: ribonuclease P protein subunit [Thermoplasmata archaeon]|nr:ribonuclease P protein subunit [Thermoplasmata archaeon]